MGMSSSQGRLLSITARLTSNEYESQQISNAKMRLSTQSQEASQDYIAALNRKQLSYRSYDAYGDTSSQTLTAGALYQYSDLKNQYVLNNAAGQALIQKTDADNFKNASCLDDFLQSYGLVKEWKSTTLESNYNTLTSDEYQDYYEKWTEARKKVMDGGNSKEDIKPEEKWQKDLDNAAKYYDDLYDQYQRMLVKVQGDLFPTESERQTAMEELANLETNLTLATTMYNTFLTYDSWVNFYAMYTDIKDTYPYGNSGTSPVTIPWTENYALSGVYENELKYEALLQEFNAEAEDYGTTLEDLYVWNDASKAQWYTNLWYRLNGPSSQKSKAGEDSQNYSVLDPHLLTSETWIQDALSQGIITIEIVTNKNEPNVVVNADQPFNVNLAGISWKSIIYTSCSDINSQEDDAAIARAEAEYKHKTEEINSKDQKYQNKIKMLDTEHTALQTEYESVKTAMNKNIDRSFKVFS